MRNRTGPAILIFVIHLVCPAYSVTIGHPNSKVCLDCGFKLGKCSTGSRSQTCIAGHPRFPDSVLQVECDAGDPYQKMKIDEARRLIEVRQVHGVDYCLTLTDGEIMAFETCHYERIWYSQEIYFK
jgi:hypothetical protein